MDKDLGFTATVYALAATAFFWGYCLFKVPSNIRRQLLHRAPALRRRASMR